MYFRFLWFFRNNGGYYISSQIKVVDTGVKNWLSVMTTNNWFALALELFICGIHPFPGDIKSNYLSPSGKNRNGLQ
jgi:hypothetical protein